MTTRDKDVSRAIGDALTRAKTDAGLTFEDLAQMTGLSRPHVTRILYGTIDPRVGDLRRLCELLEVDPHSVLCGALAPS